MDHHWMGRSEGRLMVLLSSPWSGEGLRSLEAVKIITKKNYKHKNKPCNHGLLRFKLGQGA